jgi:hypothetical protein
MPKCVLAVKNWAKFQHYEHRRPPWIKLHRELLDDYDFQCLPLASRALAPMLWLLASESSIDGIIQMDSYQHLAFRLRTVESDLKVALDPLIKAGFFEDASGVLAGSVQPATPETETETETEKISLSEEKPSDQEILPPSKKKQQPPSQEASRLAALLKSEILRNKADYRITEQQERKWAVTADRMLRLDGRTEAQITDLIRWVQRDEFWMANVLSMDKLRERFDALELKRQRAPQSRNSDNGNGPAFTLPASYVPASVQIRREQEARKGAADESGQ